MCTHVNFKRINIIEAMYGKSSVNVASILFTHLKISRQWKSIRTVYLNLPSVWFRQK